KGMLQGDLGAGKTSLVGAILQHLGSSDVVSSPTFSLVNEYQAPFGYVYHFDLYRINGVEELYDFGFEEYFRPDSLVIIEWPEIARDLLSDEHTLLKLSYAPEGGRYVEVLENGLFSSGEL
ncbi:MAG: tRNA (adenosine(37)-N6)-threonylcarbamoyltransferase complex ATPase subunit type 1 TsaE, partial [Bacteroidetes bacterium]